MVILVQGMAAGGLYLICTVAAAVAGVSAAMVKVGAAHPAVSAGMPAGDAAEMLEIAAAV
jgi:hypothetical protein